LHPLPLSKARAVILGALGFAAAVIAPLTIFACEDTASQPQDYTSLLQALADETTVPNANGFATQADALVTSLKTLETTNDAASLKAAQEAWRATRKAYRLLDAEHYGPMTEQGTTDKVDTFPADPGALASLAAQPTPGVAAAPNNAKGFLALELLLFSPGNELADAKKRTLARTLGEDIAANAHALADAWTTGGFATQLKTAGHGSTRYATQRAALDDVMAGVGYALELVVAVDLANPLGRQNAGQPDPKQVVAALSDNSVADMIATLDGVSAAYEGRGFNVITRSQSAALDDTFRSQLATCKSKLTALSRPFSSAIVSQTSAVTDAYEACKTAKNTWAAEVTSALGATVKPADTDGD
jgi:predicted lipoprotein